MPDLSEDAIETYWQSKGRDLARTVEEIEKAEDWVVDGMSARVRDALIALGADLDEAPEGRLAAMAGSPETVDMARTVLAYVKAGKRFRLLASMAEERGDGGPLAAAVLAPSASSTEAAESARVLRSSVRHLARLNLLFKVFSPERLKLIEEAIRDEE